MTARGFSNADVEAYRRDGWAIVKGTFDSADVSGWMHRKGYASVSQLRGSMSQQAVPDSSAFVRGNYIRVLESYKGGTT